VSSSFSVGHLLSDPLHLAAICGVLAILKKLWKVGLRVLAEMCEDFDDFKLRRQASKRRLQFAQSTEVPRGKNRQLKQAGSSTQLTFLDS
jgi:hypothetical protein